MTVTRFTSRRAPLTPRQAQILTAIVTHYGRTGYYPTVREIGAAVGIASPNGVVCHLRAMARKGFVAWEATTRGTPGARARSVVVPELRAAAGRAAAALLKVLRGAGRAA